MRVQAPQEQRERNRGGMRDDVYGGRIRVGASGRFQHGRAQARIGPLFGGEGEIDDGEIRRLARQFQRFAAGVGRPGQEDGARVGESVRVERLDHGGLIAQARERAGLSSSVGDQAQMQRGLGVRGEIADLAAQQRFAADQRHAGDRAA